MSYSFSGSNDISASAAIATSYPVTISFLCEQSSISGTQRIIFLTNSDATQRFAFIYSYVDQVVYTGAYSNPTSGESGKGSISASTPYHYAGVFAATNSRTAYLNNSAGTTNTTSVTPSGNDRVGIGGFAGTNRLYGKLAELAIWSVSLGASEIASLSKGFKPHRVRPQSLLFYAPFVRNLVDLKANITLTNNNSVTVANHPRVY